METKENKKDLVKETLLQTKSFMTKLFDTVDSIDRAMYGRRMRLFIWGSLMVLIVAPILDWLFEKIIKSYPNDLLTFLSTLIFMIFIILLILAFIGSWRDDSGNWTLKRTLSRLKTYYESSRDSISETKTSSKDEILYKAGTFFFIGALCWKALQNLSVFIRKPIESLFSTRLLNARDFERFTNHYFWIVLLVGLIILVYLYYTDKKILIRIKNELRQLFNWKTGYEKVKIKIAESNLVLNAKNNDHINNLTSSNSSNLFNDFVLALNKWNPRDCYYEYEFQDNLYRHLRKNLPDATVEMEFPIGEKSQGNKGRADIVVNETILIEMKRDSSTGAIQRAKGQIHQYSEIWKDKGPVILLLCDFNYEQAKITFTPVMNDLAKLERNVMTIVAKPI